MDVSSDGSTPALQGGVHPGRTVTRWVGLEASATDAGYGWDLQTSCGLTAAGAMHDDLAGLGNVPGAFDQDLGPAWTTSPSS